MRWFLALILVLIWTSSLQLAADDSPPPLEVSSKFPGGSAKVESIDQKGRTIVVSPFSHVGRGWVCWWYFKVEGIQLGETITIEVSAGSAPGASFALPDQAMFSLDNKDWQHTASGKRMKNRIVYQQKIAAKVAWFAWGPPFTLQHAQELVDRVAKSSPHAKAFELCKSKEGRSVPALRIQQGEDSDDRVVLWITARQHAWESGGSWVSQGLIEWLVSDDPRAEELRKKAVIYIVPIMDVDNVEIGAGGKNQDPHDHNRDWSDEPVWNEVRACIEQIRALSRRRFDLFLDLHNPGPGDRQPFFFIPPPEVLSPTARGNLDNFLGAARAEITGPLKLVPIPRESGPKYDPNWKKISGNWIVTNTLPHTIGLCLETSWNTPHSTQANYRRVGQELGLAIERYFRQAVRSEKKE
jgi:hypothetical protein